MLLMKPARPSYISQTNIFMGHVTLQFKLHVTTLCPLLLFTFCGGEFNQFMGHFVDFSCNNSSVKFGRMGSIKLGT